MDLMVRIHEFLLAKHGQVKAELEAKYGVPPEEVDELASSYIQDTFASAVSQADEICKGHTPAVIFIGRSNCPICQENRPLIQQFLDRHQDIRGFVIDYEKPDGLLYHIIHQDQTGLLPMIAMVDQCQVKITFTGRDLDIELLERCYQGCEVMPVRCGHNQLEACTLCENDEMNLGCCSTDKGGY